MQPRRPFGVAGLALVLATGLVLAGCGGGGISPDEVEADISARLGSQVGSPIDDVQCPDTIPSKPGETFTYSNMGFVFVGAMLERTTGKTWEELVTDRVFAPLGLASAGFGPQATLGRVDAPLGHQVVDGRLMLGMVGG